MTCNTQYVNPLGLQGDITGDREGQEGGDPTVSMGSGRRRKRSTVKRTLRNKRQEAPAEQQETQNITLVRVYTAIARLRLVLLLWHELY